jgi:hypothetical protein
MLNIALAFAVAPFVGVLLGALLVTPAFGEFSAWGLYFGFGLFFAYPCALVFGLPLYLFAQRLLGSLRLWHCVVGGIVSTLPGLYFVLAPENSLYFQRSWPMNTTLSLVAGAVSGGALWLVMRAMRSNPSFKRTPGGAA